MDVIRHIPGRMLLLFATATVVIQLSAVSMGFYLRWTEPRFEVAGASTPEPSASSFFGRNNELLQELPVLEQELAEPSAEGDSVVEETEPAEIPAAEETTVLNGVKIVSYRIQSGDTLTKVWQKHAGSHEGGIKAAQAFKAAGVGLSSLRVGSLVELQIADGDVTAFRMELSNGEVLTLDGSSAVGYVGKKVTPKVIEEQKIVSGEILNSFSLAARRHELPYALVDRLVDIFGSRIEFRRDVQPGDTFTVMYVERRLETGKVLDPGDIKAASFENDGRWFAAVQYIDSKGVERYYDSTGKPMGSYFLRYPLRFTRISSVFNKSRFHPVLKRTRPHNGVDFAAPIGTPVRSVADGVVSVSGYRGGAGNMVKIKHGTKYATAYLHLNKIAKGVRSGTRVARGQVIGTVGKTGLATGPHLHYSFYVNGRYVDPLKVELPDEPNKYEAIPANYLENVLDELKSSHADLHLALEDSAGQPIG